MFIIYAVTNKSQERALGPGKATQRMCSRGGWWGKRIQNTRYLSLNILPIYPLNFHPAPSTGQEMFNYSFILVFFLLWSRIITSPGSPVGYFYIQKSIPPWIAPGRTFPLSIVHLAERYKWVPALLGSPNCTIVKGCADERRCFSWQTPARPFSCHNHQGSNLEKNPKNKTFSLWTTSFSHGAVPCS